MNLSFFRTYTFRLIVLLILGLLLFEFYVFLRIGRDKRMRADVRYVRDYERVLCAFDKPRIKVDVKKGRCPRDGIVTTFHSGPFAVNMWQYANVIASAIATGLDPYIPICLRESLGEVFVNVSVPLLGEIGHCVLPLPDSASTVEEWMDAGQSIVFQSDDLYNDVVVKYLDLVRDYFVFLPQLKEVARHYLLTAKPRNLRNATYIGVYITRTSIIVNQEYDDVYPSVQFFVDAVNHFRAEFPNAVFVVITDRKAFWEYIFGKKNVYVIDEDSMTPNYAPLAVLSHCNHSIIASDDFAVWGAILAGGKAIVSLCISEDFNILMQRKSNWNYLLNNTKSVNKFLDRLF